MSDLYWLTDEQMERLRPYFPKSHGRPQQVSSASLYQLQ
jgi:transposase